MKPVWFLGDSLKALRSFPNEARHNAGRQLQRVQKGVSANDFKPMHSIGVGVEEIRIREADGTSRVVYTARFVEAVYVLHAHPEEIAGYIQTRYRDCAGEISAADAEPQMKRMHIDKFESVWDAVAETPMEAANLRLRSELMDQIEAIIKKKGWTQAEAARRCGITQPRMNDLLRGRISRFSLDALVNIAGSLGKKVKLQLEAA